MTSPTTDTEYSSSARAALIQIARQLESPCALLSADAQIRFIQMTADVVLPVVNSEPHLRGAAVEAMQQIDAEVARRERNVHRALAEVLRDALKCQPLPRGVEHRKAREALIERADAALHPW